MADVKSGLRTTEFWLSLMGAVVPVMNTYFGLALPVEGVVSLGGIIVSYVLSRTLVKRAA